MLVTEPTTDKFVAVCHGDAGKVIKVIHINIYHTSCVSLINSQCSITI
jgi:hypothetical protein